jgi:hypothetical protein
LTLPSVNGTAQRYGVIPEHPRTGDVVSPGCNGGTGKRVRISGFEEWTFGDDDLVAESQGHYDQGEYNRQLEHGAAGPQ